MHAANTVMEGKLYGPTSNFTSEGTQKRINKTQSSNRKEIRSE